MASPTDPSPSELEDGELLSDTDRLHHLACPAPPSPAKSALPLSATRRSHHAHTGHRVYASAKARKVMARKEKMQMLRTQKLKERKAAKEACRSIENGPSHPTNPPHHPRTHHRDTWPLPPKHPALQRDAHLGPRMRMCDQQDDESHCPPQDHLIDRPYSPPFYAQHQQSERGLASRLAIGYPKPALDSQRASDGAADHFYPPPNHPTRHPASFYPPADYFQPPIHSHVPFAGPSRPPSYPPPSSASPILPPELNSFPAPADPPFYPPQPPPPPAHAHCQTPLEYHTYYHPGSGHAQPPHVFHHTLDHSHPLYPHPSHLHDSLSHSAASSNSEGVCGHLLPPTATVAQQDEYAYRLPVEETSPSLNLEHLPSYPDSQIFYHHNNPALETRHQQHVCPSEAKSAGSVASYYGDHSTLHSTAVGLHQPQLVNHFDPTSRNGPQEVRDDEAYRGKDNVLDMDEESMIEEVRGTLVELVSWGVTADYLVGMGISTDLIVGMFEELGYKLPKALMARKGDHQKHGSDRFSVGTNFKTGSGVEEQSEAVQLEN